MVAATSFFCQTRKRKRLRFRNSVPGGSRPVGSAPEWVQKVDFDGREFVSKSGLQLVLRSAE